MIRWEWYAPLLGRLLVGGFFLWSGILNVLNLDDVAATLVTATDVTNPISVTLLLTAVEIFAGIFLIIGWQTRVVSLVLAIYLILMTFFLHTNFTDPTQTQIFLQDLALVGGLLYMSAYGSNDKTRFSLRLPRRR